MLVLTVQKKAYAKDILQGVYQPDLWKSDFALLSTRFMRCYQRVLKRLDKKLSYSLSATDSCYWGWVTTPFYGMYGLREGYVAIFTEIEDSSIVLSDYDKYTDYVHGATNKMNFFVSGIEGKQNKCIQASFRGIGKIKLVVELDKIKDMKGNVQDVYYKLLMMDKKVV